MYAYSLLCVHNIASSSPNNRVNNILKNYEKKEEGKKQLKRIIAGCMHGRHRVFLAARQSCLRKKARVPTHQSCARFFPRVTQHVFPYPRIFYLLVCQERGTSIDTRTRQRWQDNDVGAN